MTATYTKVIDKEEDDCESPDVVEIDPHSLYPVKKLKQTKQQARSLKSARGGICPCCCYIVLGLVAVSLVMMTVAVTMLYFWTRAQVQRFTVPEGRSLPVTPIPESELEIVKDRAALFFDTVGAGKVPDEDFRITVDEMNGFFAHSDYLRGNAYVTAPEGNSLVMDMSLPMDFLPGGKGRFFVATGSVDISTPDADEEEAQVTMQLDTPTHDWNGPLFFASMLMHWDDSLNPRYSRELVVNLKSGSFTGQNVSQDFIDQKQNLVQAMYDECDNDDGGYEDDNDDCHHCEMAVTLDRIDSVSIDLLSVTIHARRDSTKNNNNNMVIPTILATTTSGVKTWTDHAARKLMGLSKMLF